MESAFAARHNQEVLRTAERAENVRKAEFVQELEALKKSCHEKGIAEDSLEYELQLENLYEKYQKPESDVSDASDEREVEENERA